MVITEGLPLTKSFKAIRPSLGYLSLIKILSILLYLPPIDCSGARTKQSLIDPWKISLDPIPEDPKSDTPEYL